MVTAARTLSQVVTHMAIAFGITYAFTGSFAFGGLAALIEPVCNVALLPLHIRLWQRLRSQIPPGRMRTMVTPVEKVSQVGLHMGVAFGVMYWATGSVAFGGLIAILEPICNVAVLPAHDRLWENIRARLARMDASPAAARLA